MPALPVSATVMSARRPFTFELMKQGALTVGPILAACAGNVGNTHVLPVLNTQVK